MKTCNTMFKKMLDDRLGMFVHYGIYSEMAGSFNGVETDWLGEWIQRKLEIPIAEYEAFGRANFYTKPDFAKELVSNAKKAGIKYIVLTSKHHDGFCLFKSNYTNYSTYDFFGRDICKELSDECKKQGLELGLYYSHTLDWYEKDAGGNIHTATGCPSKNRNFWDFSDDNINFEKYLYEKCFPQVKELLTNYGDLKLIWFDFPHDITKEQSQELRALVKSLQPNCQINSRIAHNCNDYESLGDNMLPFAPVNANLECLITLNDTWGYKKQDNNWKTTKEVIEILCRTLSSDSTLLLNVGPMGDGSLTPETVKILEEMGEWTGRNQEAIYNGIEGNPFTNIFSWGFVSHKGQNLYLYLKDTTQKQILLNIGKQNSVKAISILGSDAKVDFTQENETIKIITCETDFIFPVYKLEFYNNPTYPKVIVQHGDTLSLAALWAGKINVSTNNSEEKLYLESSIFVDDKESHGLYINRQCLSDFWKDSNEIMCWDLSFIKPGKYSATLVALPTASSEEYCGYILTVNDTSFEVNVKEEKSRYNISRTGAENIRACFDAGIFEIKAAGTYKVLLKRALDGKAISIEKIDFAEIK